LPGVPERQIGGTPDVFIVNALSLTPRQNSTMRRDRVIPLPSSIG
jgi:hypothetical protein